MQIWNSKALCRHCQSTDMVFVNKPNIISAPGLKHPSAKILAFYKHLSCPAISTWVSCLCIALNKCMIIHLVYEADMLAVEKFVVCGRHLRKTFQPCHWLFGSPNFLPATPPYFPIFRIALYLASPPHPRFLAIFLSWIFCPTHSRISIPAATDLCALLLSRFPPLLLLLR